MLYIHATATINATTPHNVADLNIIRCIKNVKFPTNLWRQLHPV